MSASFRLRAGSWLLGKPGSGSTTLVLDELEVWAVHTSCRTSRRKTARVKARHAKMAENMGIEMNRRTPKLREKGFSYTFFPNNTYKEIPAGT